MRIDQRRLETARSEIHKFCAANDAELLYAVIFGSHLYGTEIEGKSDLDIKGVFLPAASKMLLGEGAKNLHFSTGADHERNSPDDLDIDLWSIQHWLLTLLPSGDTHAMDLLFSPSNRPLVLYMAPGMESLFANSARLVNHKGANGYVSYSLGQAKKYGIKGSRLGALKRVYNFLRDNCSEAGENERLRDWIPRLLDACGDARYCDVFNRDGVDALRVLGKIHGGAIRLREFIGRINREYEKYGDRAREAEMNRGVDFKALSHAVRAIDQIEELATTGAIKYPLKSAEYLKEIKLGKYGWPELEGVILAKLERATKLCAEVRDSLAYDRTLAEKIILDLYGETRSRERSGAPGDL